jgi:hypothetical protein
MGSWVHGSVGPAAKELLNRRPRDLIAMAS